MKSKFTTVFFVIGALLAPAIGHAADSDKDRSKPVAFVKDSVITTKIKTKLAAEHAGSLKHIKVDTDMDGIVWLSGTANTKAEADKAVSIASGTEGVKSVRSDIKVVKDK